MIIRRQLHDPKDLLLRVQSFFNCSVLNFSMLTEACGHVDVVFWGVRGGFAIYLRISQPDLRMDMLGHSLLGKRFPLVNEASPCEIMAFELSRMALLPFLD